MNPLRNETDSRTRTNICMHEDLEPFYRNAKNINGGANGVLRRAMMEFFAAYNRLLKTELPHEVLDVLLMELVAREPLIREHPQKEVLLFLRDVKTMRFRPEIVASRYPSEDTMKEIAKMVRGDARIAVALQTLSDFRFHGLHFALDAFTHKQDEE